MFALLNPMSHVSSAVFAQAGLRPGSSSAQVCSGLLTLFTCLTRNHQLLTRDPKRPPPLARDPKYLLLSFCTHRGKRIYYRLYTNFFLIKIHNGHIRKRNTRITAKPFLDDSPKGPLYRGEKIEVRS